MLEILNNVWEIIKALGGTIVLLSPDAFVKCVIVLVCVFGLRLTKLLKTGNWARAAVLVMTTMLSGVTTTATPDQLVTFTLVAGFASGIYELLEKILGMFVVKA